MNKNLKTKELMLSGLLLAIGILLPMIFHSVGIMGKVFLPMHIPVLIGGFLLSPYLAFILGVITPVISGALTGMPIMFPMAIIMAFELGTYGLIASLAVRRIELSVIPSLITAMIFGRIVAGVVVFFLAQFFGLKMNPLIFIKGGIITGLPGIVLQLIIIPTILFGLKGIIKKEWSAGSLYK
ncbi:ECF transporter S component [Crassaminicella indica]|uniref:ECF transporter S component n=1 Tax=Crassaminicella indica TaxID=2855394 RepID=A0ABX8RDH3_9CLOT|nr:ECF transporter S component [Crassaminicella indica]QXM07125.1 ECF transporter S component [Crassaminicella indica]